MGIELPATPTPTTLAEASMLVNSAWAAVNGSLPPRLLAIYSLALAWVETGRGKSLIQNNPGNLFARGFVPASGGAVERDYSKTDFWRPPWYRDGSRDVEMYAGKIPSAFRAYSQPIWGWLDFVKEIARRQPLVNAALQDNPTAFTLALANTGYSSSYGDEHAKTFRSLVNEFKSIGLFADAPDVEPAKGVRSGGNAFVGMLMVLLGATVLLLAAKRGAL